MTPLTLTVNGRKVCRLTGTHLGCEHGVCSACAELVDEEPVRSCIAFAVTCDGQSVRTIEGFEDDALMQRCVKRLCESTLCNADSARLAC